MSTFAGVVFDLDGTLVDTESVSHRVLATSLAALGHTITDDELHLLRGQAWSFTSTWLHDRFGVTTEEYREQSRDGWDAAFDAGIDTFADTTGVLARLADEGVPLAVCTSSGRGHLERVLASVPVLTDVFDVSVSATDVTNHKPDPEPYRLAVSLLGTPPEHTVAIEDTETGATAAVAAGLRVIGRSAGPATDLSVAHLIVDTLTYHHLASVLP